VHAKYQAPRCLAADKNDVSCKNQCSIGHKFGLPALRRMLDMAHESHGQTAILLGVPFWTARVSSLIFEKIQ
jgi:hypothetical protein